jgi:4'-phosphopantetheinyl transferase EntD
MLSAILPGEAIVREQFGSHQGALMEEELAALGRSVKSRRLEFAAGRSCARSALAALGIPAGPILTGAGREPLWPAGIVGSITHCEGYCAAAVAPTNKLVSVGIDAELNQPLPAGILETIATDVEISSLRALPVNDLSWDRLLFSAKESMYKAWYPIMKCWLGFEEACVTIDPVASSFQVSISLTDHPVKPFRDSQIDGRYISRRGYILTSVCILPERMQENAEQSYIHTLPR